jgi:hypothetical protein
LTYLNTVLLVGDRIGCGRGVVAVMDQYRVAVETILRKNEPDLLADQGSLPGFRILPLAEENLTQKWV